MPEASYDIVIVGGGIVGLALARALAGSGLSLALVDASEPAPPAGSEAREGEAPDFDSRVSALTVASIGLFHRLGAWEAIQAAGACPFEEMRVWDADGTGSIHFSAADVHQRALGYIAGNRAIGAALDALLEDQEGLRRYRPARVAGIEPLGEPGGSCFRVLLEGGPALRARLLVGADGASSAVREAAGFRVKEWEYGHRAIVSTVRTELPHQFTAWQRFMPTGPLAFLPLQNRAAEDRGEQCWSSIVWSCRPALAEELMNLDEQGFARRLEQAFEARLGRVLWTDQRFSFPLRQMHATEYVAEGVALIGDAAHTIHPLAGQGVNLGLLDAEALAAVLAGAVAAREDIADCRVLSRYQRRRKGHNLGMMALMEGFKRLFESDALPLRWLRNAGISTVDRLPVVKKELMSRAMGL